MLEYPHGHMKHAAPPSRLHQLDLVTVTDQTHHRRKVPITDLSHGQEKFADMPRLSDTRRCCAVGGACRNVPSRIDVVSATADRPPHSRTSLMRRLILPCLVLPRLSWPLQP